MFKKKKWFGFKTWEMRSVNLTKEKKKNWSFCNT